MTTRPDGGKRKPFRVKCVECRHVWPLAWLPMVLSMFGEIVAAARCPVCGARQIFAVDATDLPEDAS